MYFIARNNAMYSYIAHTSLKRCYMATFIAVCAFFIIGIYGIYYPLLAHITLLKSESITLQKQFDEIAQLDSSRQEMSVSIDSGKKSIADRAVDSSQREEHCHKRMLFVLDTITQSGLTLNAYDSCKVKDKEWYTKDSAHFDIIGSMPKLMTFLETVKKSRSMITLSHVTITRVADDMFKMSCDVGVITIKK